MLDPQSTKSIPRTSADNPVDISRSTWGSPVVSKHFQFNLITNHLFHLKISPYNWYRKVVLPNMISIRKTLIHFFEDKYHQAIKAIQMPLGMHMYNFTVNVTV